MFSIWAFQSVAEYKNLWYNKLDKSKVGKGVELI